MSPNVIDLPSYWILIIKNYQLGRVIAVGPG
jgi:hypothetical protein